MLFLIFACLQKIHPLAPIPRNHKTPIDGREFRKFIIFKTNKPEVIS